jgi:hypothetical protein
MVVHTLVWRAVFGRAAATDLTALAIAAIEVALEAEKTAQEEPLVHVSLNAVATLLDRGFTPGPLASAEWIVGLYLAQQDSAVVSLAEHVLRAGGFVRARSSFPLESSDLGTPKTPFLLALVDLGHADRALKTARIWLQEGPAPTLNAWLDFARVAVITNTPLYGEFALPSFVRHCRAARRILGPTLSR